MTGSVLVIGALGAVFMVLSLVGSVYPVPAAPYNYFPYAFAAYMLIGLIWYMVVKARAPQVITGIEHDMESAVGPLETMAKGAVG